MCVEDGRLGKGCSKTERRWRDRGIRICDREGIRE